MSQVQVAPRFPVLDALRAVGALAVLTTHVGFYAGQYEGHGTWGSFLARLDVGVALFFVLSGFLLSRPYLVSARTGRPRPRRRTRRATGTPAGAAGGPAVRTSSR